MTSTNDIDDQYINLFIVNSSGKLWIPRRTHEKRIFPDCLDFSCGGHMAEGETYEQTPVREVAEELNFDITSMPYKKLGFMSEKDGISGKCELFELQMDTEPKYNTEDFQEAFWLAPQELMDRIENGEKAKSDLPVVIKKYYLT
jgi:isopentenyl-diphosphate delta-isomerase